MRLPPEWADYPEHDHTTDEQEEVYVVLQGSARLEAGGESWRLEPGLLVRVGSGQKRKIFPSGEGVTILAIGSRAAAQRATTGSIGAQVQDQPGLPLPGVTVTVTTPQGGSDLRDR